MGRNPRKSLTIFIYDNPDHFEKICDYAERQELKPLLEMENLNAKNSQNYTPLCHLAKIGKHAAVNFLLENRDQFQEKIDVSDAIEGYVEGSHFIQAGNIFNDIAEGIKGVGSPEYKTYVSQQTNSEDKTYVLQTNGVISRFRMINKALEGAKKSGAPHDSITKGIKLLFAINDKETRDLIEEAFNKEHCTTQLTPYNTLITRISQVTSRFKNSQLTTEKSAIFNNFKQFYANNLDEEKAELIEQWARQYQSKHNKNPFIILHQQRRTSCFRFLNPEITDSMQIFHQLLADQITSDVLEEMMQKPELYVGATDGSPLIKK